MTTIYELGQRNCDSRAAYLERQERAKERERGFCLYCGATIPHRLGEGRCQHCAHWNLNPT